GRAAAVPDPHAGPHQPLRDQAAADAAVPRPGLARSPGAIALGGRNPVAVERAEQRSVRQGPPHAPRRRVLERLDQLVAARPVRLAPEGERLAVCERVFGGSVESGAAAAVQGEHLERQRARVCPLEAVALYVRFPEQPGRVARQRAHPTRHRQLLAGPTWYAGEPWEAHLRDGDRARRVDRDSPLRYGGIPEQPHVGGDAQRRRFCEPEVAPLEGETLLLAGEAAPGEAARRSREHTGVGRVEPVEPPQVGAAVSSPGARKRLARRAVGERYE